MIDNDSTIRVIITPSFLNALDIEIIKNELRIIRHKMELIQHDLNPKKRNLKEGELELLEEIEGLNKKAKNHWTVIEKLISLPSDFYSRMDLIIKANNNELSPNNRVTLDGLKVKLIIDNSEYLIKENKKKLFEEIKSLVYLNSKREEVLTFLSEMGKQIH